MDVSIPEYLLFGPGFTLLILEFLFPPYMAVYSDGTVLHLGRSILLFPPMPSGALSVAIDWAALGFECLVLGICLAVSYRLLSRAAPLWARD
jgi:hypothetical protein